jgi:hypothetical protein
MIKLRILRKLTYQCMYRECNKIEIREDVCVVCHVTVFLEILKESQEVIVTDRH